MFGKNTVGFAGAVLLCTTLPFVAANGVWAATLTGGNGIYTVSVADDGSASCGAWTAVTAGLHPVGAGQNVLFGNGTPNTSNTILRSYDTGSFYATGASAAGCTEVCGLDTPTITPLLNGATTVGYELLWEIVDGGNTIEFTQTVIVEGPVNGTETVDNSVIRETHTIRNLGPGSFSYGLRKQWDWQVGTDDGPWFGDCLNPGTACDTSMNLTASTPPVYSNTYTINEDPASSGCTAPVAPQNPAGCGGAPPYLVAATVAPPSGLVPAPDAPELLQFNSWPNLISDCWEPFLTNNATCAGGDSAVAYFYGRTGATALTLAPSGERSLTQYALAAGTACPEIIQECGNGVIDPGEDCDPPASQGGAVDCGDNCLTLPNLCGNGVINAGEQCDPPASQGGAPNCDDNCLTSSLCGNGVVDPFEECDPGVPGVELCGDGADNDNDGCTDCEDVASCPVACSQAPSCTTAADCIASEFVDPSLSPPCFGPLPDSACVDGTCRVACLNHEFCKQNFGNGSFCVAQPTCNASCALADQRCQKLGRDPSRIKFGGEGKRDMLYMHGRFRPDNNIDPVAAGLVVELRNANGQVYHGALLPGDLVDKNGDGKVFRYRDKTARKGDKEGLRFGLERVDLKRQVAGNFVDYTFKIRAYTDLDAATLSRMTTTVSIGNEGTSLSADWRQINKGWVLRQFDIDN